MTVLNNIMFVLRKKKKRFARDPLIGKLCNWLEKKNDKKKKNGKKLTRDGLTIRDTANLRLYKHCFGYFAFCGDTIRIDNHLRNRKTTESSAVA